VIRKLREAERLLASGKEVEEVCRSLEISVQTYHRLKAQYQVKRSFGAEAEVSKTP
jgi:hypothetical protein